MRKGVIAGNFDVLHPGYIKMFNEAAANCDCLIVLLQTDPTVERPEKLKPILSIEERKEMLFSLKSVCDVLTYTYEAQLLDILKLGEFDVRFLGDDYIGKPFTGDHLSIPIHWIKREHGWSTTKFKELIAQSIKN
jgi:glycerol-3-phosphate cytidylyltransferase